MESWKGKLWATWPFICALNSGDNHHVIDIHYCINVPTDITKKRKKSGVFITVIIFFSFDKIMSKNDI